MDQCESVLADGARSNRWSTATPSPVCSSSAAAAVSKRLCRLRLSSMRLAAQHTQCNTSTDLDSIRPPRTRSRRPEATPANCSASRLDLSPSGWLSSTTAVASQEPCWWPTNTTPGCWRSPASRIWKPTSRFRRGAGRGREAASRDNHVRSAGRDTHRRHFHRAHHYRSMATLRPPAASACRPLVVFGDALCHLNPRYGQGMTMSALQPLALQDCLREGDTDLPALRRCRCRPPRTGVGGEPD